MLREQLISDFDAKIGKHSRVFLDRAFDSLMPAIFRASHMIEKKETGNSCLTTLTYPGDRRQDLGGAWRA